MTNKIQEANLAMVVSKTFSGLNVNALRYLLPLWIALFPEFKKVVLASKMLRLSKLEQLILNAKRAGELRNDVDTSILAKNLLNISVGVINYLIMHQDISYALSAVRSQYEQLYSLAVGE